MKNIEEQATRPNIPFQPIAIVGMASLYPQSIHLEAFWKNILSGRDLLSQVPKTHWLLEDFYDPDPKAVEKTYCRRGGIIPFVPFDYLSFGIPPNVLSSTDAMQLLALAVAKALFDNAFGEKFSQIDREKVGVTVGYSLGTSLMTEIAGTQHFPEWVQALREAGLDEEAIRKVSERRMSYATPWTENTFPGLLQNVISGRIANRFDLHGPNCSIDAACASSLAALDLGIKQLQTGEVDLAVAGGAQSASSPLMFLCFSKTPAMSPSERCAPFDESSDGTMIGEGVGLLALKRLSDAERDGDKIYAVIRGVGASSDGKGKSIYAPEAEGQIRALNRAYARAGYGPEAVELVEAHGTGTKAGDAAELKTLFKTFQASGRADLQWCALGSIKSQIGHTAGAAGAASLIKVALALHHKVLPPTANLSQPTTQVDFKSSPFYLNERARPWIHISDQPRRASVSSFGFGGTNYHVTVEEYQGMGPRHSRLDSFPSELFLFSGQDVPELGRQIQSFLQEISPERTLFGLAKQSRGKFQAQAPHRLALVAEGGEELRRKLDVVLSSLTSRPELLWMPPQGIFYKPTFQRQKLAFLFPGQGSQYLHMGADWAMAFDGARQIWDQGDRVRVDPRFRLSEVVFPHSLYTEADRTGALDRLTATEWAQPSLGITSAALLALTREWGLTADMVGGHSFGEEAALYHAGCYDLENFLKIARRRGELMSRGNEIQGGMLAVAAPAARIEEWLRQWGSTLIIANYNSPRQSVLSGESEAIREAQARLEALGVKATVLRVATAFHSSIVSPSAEAFLEFLKGVEIRGPGIPVYSNLNAGLYPNDPEEIRRVMARHLACPVRFVDQIEKMHGDGANVFVEVGPGTTLSRLVEECLEGREHLAIPLDTKGKDGITGLLLGLARLTAIGLPLNLRALDDRGLEEALPVRNATTLMINSATYQKKYPPLETSSVPIPLPKAKPEPAVTAQAVGSTLQPGNQGIGPSAFHPSNLAEEKTMPRAPSLRPRVESRAAPAAPVFSSVSPPSAPQPQKALPIVTTPPPSGVASVPRQADTSALKELLLSVVAEKTGYPREMLNLEMNLEADLGIDSIKRVEILSAMQERRPDLPEVEAERLAELQTLGQIVEFMGGPGAAVSAPAPSISQIPVPPVKEAAAPPVPSTVAVDSSGLKDLLLAVVAEKTGYPREMLNLEMNLEADLGIDSIKRVEILSAIQERRPDLPEVEAERLAELQTLGQIVEFMGGPGAGPAPAPTRAPVPVPERREAPPSPEVQAPSSVAPTLIPSLKSYHLRLVPYAEKSHVGLAPQGWIDVTDDGGGVGEAMVRMLNEAGMQARLISGEGEAAAGQAGAALIFLGGLRPSHSFYGASKVNKEAFRLAQRYSPSLREAIRAGGAWWITVTEMGGDFGMGNSNPAKSIAGGLSGLTKTLAQEWPGLYAKAIDLKTEGKMPQDIAAEIINEIFQGGGQHEVALHPSQGRMALELAEAPIPGVGRAPLNEKSILVVSGGARGVTAHCLVALAKKYRPRIVLFGRSAVPEEEPEWYRTLPDEASLKRAFFERARQEGKNPLPAELEGQVRQVLNSREVRRTLEALRDAGSPVKYFAVDILESRLIRTDGPTWTWKAGSLVRAALAQVRAEWGPITGLIHGAGVIADKRVEEKTQEQFDRVYDTKVLGLGELLSALEGDPLDLLVLFSSVAARFGNVGQADYAMANEALNKVAWAERARRSRACLVKSINWGAWDGGMVHPALRENFKRRGVALIGMDEGAAFLTGELESGAPEAVEVLVLPGAAEAAQTNPLLGR